MSSPIKTVAVCGATGLQGGSIVSALSAEGYSVRAVTRDDKSAKALELAKLPNVTVVKADLLDKASLVTAFQGADAVFGWTAMTETEETEGKNQADAALIAKVSIFIWSTLPSVEAATNGAVKGVNHFEKKARVDEYVRQIGLPAIFLSLGAFLENTYNFGLIKYENDEITLSSGWLPDKIVPQLQIKKDLPSAFLLLIKNYTSLLGKTIYLAPIPTTTSEQREQLERITGKKVNLSLANGDYTDEVSGMYRYFNEFGFYKGVTLPDPYLRDLGFVPSTFEEFAKEQLLPVLGL